MRFRPIQKAFFFMLIFMSMQAELRAQAPVFVWDSQNNCPGILNGDGSITPIEYGEVIFTPNISSRPTEVALDSDDGGNKYYDAYFPTGNNAHYTTNMDETQSLRLTCYNPHASGDVHNRWYYVETEWNVGSVWTDYQALLILKNLNDFNVGTIFIKNGALRVEGAGTLTSNIVLAQSTITGVGNGSHNGAGLQFTAAGANLAGSFTVVEDALINMWASGVNEISGQITSPHTLSISSANGGATLNLSHSDNYIETLALGHSQEGNVTPQLTNAHVNISAGQTTVNQLDIDKGTMSVAKNATLNILDSINSNIDAIKTGYNPNGLLMNQGTVNLNGTNGTVTVDGTLNMVNSGVINVSAGNTAKFENGSFITNTTQNSNNPSSNIINSTLSAKDGASGFELTSATVGNTTLSGLAADALVKDAKLAVNKTYKVEDVRMQDSLIEMAANASLSLEDVVFSSSTKVVGASTGKVTATNILLEVDQGTNISTSYTTGSYAGLPAEIYTIDTFGTSTTLNGELTLQLDSFDMSHLTSWSEGVGSLGIKLDNVTLGTSMSLEDITVIIAGVEYKAIGSEVKDGGTVLYFNIPEPSSAALSLVSLLGLAARRRRVRL